MKMFDIEKTRTEIEARKAMAFAWLRRNVRHVCDGGVLSRLKLEEVERPAVFDAAIDLCVVPTLSFERLSTFRGGPGAATITVVCGDKAPDSGVAGATDR